MQCPYDITRGRFTIINCIAFGVGRYIPAVGRRAPFLFYIIRLGSDSTNTRTWTLHWDIEILGLEKIVYIDLFQQTTLLGIELQNIRRCGMYVLGVNRSFW